MVGCQEVGRPSLAVLFTMAPEHAANPPLTIKVTDWFNLPVVTFRTVDIDVACTVSERTIRRLQP